MEFKGFTDMNGAEREMESGLQMDEDGLQRLEKTLVHGISPWSAERFIEEIWRDLGGAASRSRIRRVLIEAAPAYENVRIKTYVPNFLRRDVLQRLRDELNLSQGAKTPKPDKARME